MRRGVGIGLGDLELESDDLMRGSLEKKRGFTLVEIVVSMLLLSTVVAGMLVVFVVGKRSVSLAGHKVEAISFAQETIDELMGRVGVPGDTSLTPGSHPTNTLPSGDLRDKFGGTRTYWIWDVSTPPDTYKKVTVTVDWNEP